MPDDGNHERQDQAPAPEPMDREAFNKLVERLYTKLKPLAARVRWSGNGSLSPTLLLHETYLKLLQAKQFTAGTDNEVIAIFAHVMKQILMDAARRKKSLRHGAGGIVPLKDGDSQRLDMRANKDALPDEDVLTLVSAVDELRRADPGQADVIDRRYCLGLTVEETARLLGVSVSTVEREYREAMKFLRGKLRPPSRGGASHA